MKSKRLALILLFLLILAVVGCGKGKTNQYEHGLISRAPSPTTKPSITPDLEGEPTLGTDPALTGEPTPEGDPTSVPTNSPVPTKVPTNTPAPTKDPSATPTKPVSQGPNRTPGKAGQYTVVLDAGHGGKWPGAVGKTVDGKTLQESILTLKIANYCKAYLEAYYPEIKVYMTRTDEKAFSTDLAKDLKLRNQVAVDHKANALISFHLNASGTADAVSGCLVCTPHREVVKDKAVKLASAILDQLEGIGLKARPMSSGVRAGVYFRKSENGTKDSNGKVVEYYAICRNAADSGIPGIIIEHCYIDSNSDQRFLESESALRALGEADARGIAAYFGLE